jgi:hypothetical protein
MVLEGLTSADRTHLVTSPEMCIGFTRVEQDVLLYRPDTDTFEKFQFGNLSGGWSHIQIPTPVRSKESIPFTPQVAYQGYAVKGEHELIGYLGDPKQHRIVRKVHDAPARILLEQPLQQISYCPSAGVIGWVTEKGSVQAGILQWSGGKMGPPCQVEAP